MMLQAIVSPCTNLWKRLKFKYHNLAPNDVRAALDQLWNAAK